MKRLQMNQILKHTQFWIHNSLELDRMVIEKLTYTAPYKISYLKCDIFH